MKTIEGYWDQITKLLTEVNMSLSKDEEKDLYNQFTEEEKKIFHKITEALDGEESLFDDLINCKNEAQIKELLSLLLQNQNFIEKVNKILLKKSLE